MRKKQDSHRQWGPLHGSELSQWWLSEQLSQHTTKVGWLKLQAAPTTDYWSVRRQYMQYLLLRRTQNSLHPLSTSSTTACHPFLSYDQLWATSLIGRNADVEHYHMLTASRSPRMTLQCHPGWRHVTFTKCKRKIYYTLFLFTFCFFGILL